MHVIRNLKKLFLGDIISGRRLCGYITAENHKVWNVYKPIKLSVRHIAIVPEVGVNFSSFLL